MSATSGFAPLTLPGALPAPRVRRKRGAGLHLAWIVLATVLLAEAAVLLWPQALLLHPAQATALFRQVSGYTMVGLMLGAMAFGLLRRHPLLAVHHRLLGDVHQFGGLLLLMLLALHAAARPAGFLLVLFHGMAVAQAAGALRSLGGVRLPRRVGMALLVAHIGLSCAMCAVVLVHLYFVYAYTA